MEKRSKGDQEWDFIIAGAGTAGGILAYLLSFDYRVLVIERGDNQLYNPIVRNAENFIASSFDPRTAEQLLTPPDPGLLGILERYTKGNTWGGSSSVNYLLSVIGSPDYWERIAALSGPEWKFERIVELTHQLENWQGAPSPFRGNGGPINVLPLPPSLTPTSIASQIAPIIASLNAIPLVNDYNAAQGACVSPNQQNFEKREGGQRIRTQTGYAFLNRQVVDSKGRGVGCHQKLRILSDSFVSKVLFSCRKGRKLEAVGVEAIVKGICRRFHAKKVILSAGVIDTPAILQRSGIGPSGVLRQAGIPVQLENSDVGQGLKTHYGPGFVLQSTPDVAFTADILAFPQQIGGNSQVRKYETVFVPGNSGITSATAAILQIPASPVQGIFSMLNWDLDPVSTGSVQILNDDPAEEPILRFNLYSDPVDVQVAIAGAQFYKAVYDQANTNGGNFTFLYPPESAFADPDTLLTYIKAETSIGYHGVGTASFGKVVDSKLRVLGTRNLYVADLSVTPIPEDGNTAYAAMFIGLNLASFLLRDPFPLKKFKDLGDPKRC
ncbi:oxidoreductase choline DHase [Pithovirus sibericum]|uniref:Oxidoreductase choline DHase n=1 Tax=Pithovirus sibericum TaxID=1450746 RepID=W5S5G3_9VIRU|nr:oxidoreductase choline DHase [Pithovirus sibericum]AHH01909.1 oxidoreductase choline DHase [Pithovirus sibericum]